MGTMTEMTMQWPHVDGAIASRSRKLERLRQVVMQEERAVEARAATNDMQQSH